MLDLSPLFASDLVYLAPPDREGDAEIVARWYEDPEFAPLVQRGPAYPLKIEEARRKLPAAENDPNRFVFAIRLKEDSRLAGLIEVGKILWPIGVGWLSLQIGDTRDRRKGYGSQALALMLRYAFNELNLNKIISLVNGYNQPALKFFKKNGFAQEVRQREALLRGHQRWDLIWMGLTRAEWEAGSAGGLR